MNTLTNDFLEECSKATDSHRPYLHAKEISEMANRILAAEAQLAELRWQEPDLYLCPVTRSGEKLFSQCGRDYPRGRGYYARPVPPAAMLNHSESVLGMVAEKMTYADAVEFIQINGMSKEAREMVALRAFNHCRAIMPQLSGKKAYPDKLPCDVHLVPSLKIGKGCPVSTLHGALLRREEFAAELEAMTQEQRQAHDKAIADFKSEFLPKSPVIPEGWVKGKFAYDTLFNAIGKAVKIQGEALAISVKAFEEAMLAAAPQHKSDQ